MIDEKIPKERVFTDMNIGKFVDKDLCGFVDKDLNAIVNKIASMHGTDLQTRYNNLCEAYKALEKEYSILQKDYEELCGGNKNILDENAELHRRVNALEWKDSQNKMLLQRYEDIIHGVEAASGKELI